MAECIRDLMNCKPALTREREHRDGGRTTDARRSCRAFPEPVTVNPQHDLGEQTRKVVEGLTT
jgi:hypothetical protein